MRPVIVVLMGSGSDKAHAEKVAAAAETFGVDVELRVGSAHKTPSHVLSIIEHYEGIIDALGSPPIIMGHSAGGLFTQIRLDHGYGQPAWCPIEAAKNTA